MARALYDRLFSIRTLVRIACAALSLHTMGSVQAQGLPPGTKAPLYGTTWAAMQVRSHASDFQSLASDSSRLMPTEASRKMESSARRPIPRTGG
ncbi:MAG: hypothetical protein ACJ8AW_50835 [Rhodopila sp.]